MKIVSSREVYKCGLFRVTEEEADRKSKRLNSSHLGNSYAVFCLKTQETRSMGGICCTHWTTFLDLAFSPQTARWGSSITLSSTIARGCPFFFKFPPTIGLHPFSLPSRLPP